MMQRPFETVIEPHGHAEEIINLQEGNLKSAVAFAALTTPSGVNEKELYENIVEIPHYESQWGGLLDKEDEKELVQENLSDFQELYKDLCKDHFGNCFEIDDSGKFQIDQNDVSTRRFLMKHLNDNVLQNVDKKFMGVKKYHSDDSQPQNSTNSKLSNLKTQTKQSIKKDPLEREAQREIMDDLLE